jgi:hypothetical protein
MSARIGVYTPTHQVAAKLPYLQDCRHCLQTQTVSDWEWHILTDTPEDYECAKSELALPQNAHVLYGSPADRQAQHPLPWLLNRFFENSDNEFLFLYADDDLLHPELFELLISCFDTVPGDSNAAFWVSLAHTYATEPGIPPDGFPLAYWIPADGPRVQGMLDCRVDGGQVCVRRSHLDSVPKPWWPESAHPDTVRHMDGLYLENVAAKVTFFPAGSIDIPYVVHRFTPVSTFSPFGG